jgi:hypothetical protein
MEVANTATATEKLDTLLGSELQSTVETFQHGESVVFESLQRNEERFVNKIRELGVENASELADVLRNKILSIERTLAESPSWKPLGEKDGMKNSVRFIYSLCPSELKRGFFLKESYAKEALKKMPPLQLFSHVPRGEVSALSSLSVLALTRFTESREWQHKYLSWLATLHASSFEEREIKCLVIDSKVFDGVLRLAGEKQKPWRISHSKETGIIMCMTLDEKERLVAPFVQYTAVFMHYFFEVALPAQLFRFVRETEPEKLGMRIKEVILSGSQKFPFFHPNAYSEHLFWDRALKLFQASFPHIQEFSFFTDTIGCGGVLPSTGGEEVVSLNFIDHVWNINLAHLESTRAYFGGKRTSFLYHFREGLWYEIFRNLLGLSEELMDSAVILRLHLGDQPFTNSMLSLIIKAHQRSEDVVSSLFTPQ